MVAVTAVVVTATVPAGVVAVATLITVIAQVAAEVAELVVVVAVVVVAVAVQHLADSSLKTSAQTDCHATSLTTRSRRASTAKGAPSQLARLHPLGTAADRPWLALLPPWPSGLLC
jgi:hypothetical protein